MGSGGSSSGLAATSTVAGAAWATATLGRASAISSATIGGTPSPVASGYASALSRSSRSRGVKIPASRIVVLTNRGECPDSFAAASIDPQAR